MAERAFREGVLRICAGDNNGNDADAVISENLRVLSKATAPSPFSSRSWNI